MNASPKRPWYRLHWGTVLVVFFVSLAWAGHSFPSTIGMLFPTSPWHSLANRWDYIEGWPILCVKNIDTLVVTNWFGLAADCLLAVVSLTAVGFVTECLERGGTRFRSSTMLTFVAALAV